MKTNAALAILATLLGGLAPMVAGCLNRDVSFNFGPGDRSYLEGFEPSWEIDPDGLATHWSSYDASVHLPVTVKSSRARLTYRFSRVYGETAQVEVRVNSVPVDWFSARGGAYVIRSVEIPASVLERSSFEMTLSADSHERENRGLRMDWLQLELEGTRGRLAPESSTVLWSICLTLAFFVVVTLILEKPVAGVLAIPVASTIYGGMAGVFPLAHMLRWVAPSGSLLMGALVVIYAVMVKKGPSRAARWALVLIAVAFIVRAAGVFHPRYYYPDLRAHADMTRIVSEAGLDFWRQPSHYIAEQGVWTAEAMGKTYAFPFSPVFHALFVPLKAGIAVTMDAMKLFICLVSSVEILLVFYLGSWLRNEETAGWAAALAVVSPPVLSRISLAFMAALFAHGLDVLVLCAMTAAALDPSKKKLGLALVTLVLALGSYPGSLINFGLFMPILACLLFTKPELRRQGLTVLVGSAAAAVLALAVIYREFLGVFVSDMLPRFLSGETTGGEWGLFDVFYSFFHRTWIFYDGVYVLLILGGIVLTFKRKPSAVASRLLAAWGLSFLGLIFLRTAAPDLFVKIKEMLWVAPLIAILGAEALAWTKRSVPAGIWIAAGYYLIAATYGANFYARAIARTFELAR